jgi:hypothetical protein
LILLGFRQPSSWDRGHPKSTAPIPSVNEDADPCGYGLNHRPDLVERKFDVRRTCAMAWPTAGARLATAVGAGALMIRCGTIPKPDIELSSLAVPKWFSLRPAWRRVGRWRPVQQRSRDPRRSNTFGAVVGLRCGPIRVEFLTSWAPRTEEARAPCLDLGWTFTKPSESYEPVSPTSRTADWTRVDPSSGGVADRPSRLLKGEATCPGC